MNYTGSSSLFLILAFSLYVNAVRTSKNTTSKLLLAGVLIGSVFYFKSVLILMSVSVVASVCVLCLYEKRKLSIKRMMVVVFGSVLALLINLVFVLIINAAEIQDILDASKYQSSLLSIGIDITYIIKKFPRKLIANIKYIPVLIIGVVALIFNTIINVNKKQWKIVLFRFGMWLMPTIFIVLSNTYFIYHFVPYFLPCLVELYIFIMENNKIERMILYLTAIVVCVIYVCNYSVASELVRKSIAYDIQSYKENEEFFSSINFDSNDDVLFLDDGIGAYYLKSKSYLKYYFPLPLQRVNDDTNIKSHFSSKELALAYRGKYISVYDEWFFHDDFNKEIREKIDSEYCYIGSYKRFATPISLDSLQFQQFDLYEKIE